MYEIIQRPDGTTLPVLVNTVALGQHPFARTLNEIAILREASFDERYPTALVVHQDVSQQIELERRKDEFVAMASHELKTPVTSIKTYVQWLQRRLAKQGDEMGAQVLTTIDRQTETLTRLINDLLDITRMTIGVLSWQESSFDLAELIHEVVAALPEHEGSPPIHFEGVSPVQIHADRERIAQVIANLLSNALKYTRAEGSIVLRQSQERDQVTVSVQDTGIGIPQDQQTHIFERFYRVRDAEHETFPGLGLGLYLCAEIIRRQGGQIWVESIPGVGSTFFFTLVTTQPHEDEKGKLL